MLLKQSMLAKLSHFLQEIIDKNVSSRIRSARLKSGVIFDILEPPGIKRRRKTLVWVQIGLGYWHPISDQSGKSGEDKVLWGRWDSGGGEEEREGGKGGQ